MTTNPFFELYVGDRITSREFATIFSPYLVEHAEQLFLPGNIVITAIQGSGKSMLLSLLKPEIRLDYLSASAEFPVKRKLRNFVSAGINLAHSNAIDFGNRTIPGDVDEVALLFGDFVNYVLAFDLLKNIECIWGARDRVVGEVEVKLDSNCRTKLARLIRADDGWFGYFSDTEDLEAIKKKMARRIESYRRFLHMNDDKFDEGVRRTKTGIGAPLSSLVQCLRQAHVLSESTNVFLHIDQYEELANIRRTSDREVDYRAVVNRALSRRDPLLSYRIGTRGHAWRRHGRIFGTSAKLEEERDYKLIDLDHKLRRYENPKSWIFPGFAADVFARRLRHAGITSQEGDGTALIRRVFGAGLSPEQKAKRYAGDSWRPRMPAEWPTSLKNRLIKLAKENPLSARLGEAWFQQKGPSRIVGELPWETRSHQWWKKERVDAASIQVAGRCQQRPFWCGGEEIIELSGGNILTFLSICQLVWDTDLQYEQGNYRPTIAKEIDSEAQAIGIFKASDHWLKKISQETGRSGDRQRFVRFLGNMFSKLLASDEKLSYPGHNGFSISDDELLGHPQLREFLEELSDYGNLMSLPHTTKERDRRQRTKFYLNPILCPQFKISYKRTKEPKYIGVVDLVQWIEQSGVRIAGLVSAKQRQQPGEMTLFGPISGQ